MDSLGVGPLRTALEAALSQYIGTSVTISIRQDFSIPEPVQEELAPLPAPPPSASTIPAPKPHTPQKKPQSLSRKLPKRKMKITLTTRIR